MKRLIKMGFALPMVLALALGVSGCIKPEAPNAEADILTFEVYSVEHLSPPKITNNEIVITLNQWTKVDKLAPTFTLTKGATAEPKSGTVLDFTQPQKYTITSEDGKWSKVYTVRVARPSQEEQPVYKYSFEGTTMNSYLRLAELDANGEIILEWENGNYGAKLTGEKIPYTTQDAAGYQGNCVKMETKSTGLMGKLSKKPIAAGNIFLGAFDTSKMMFTPLKATKFGIPFRQEPILLTGYYKYQPGKEVIDANSKVVSGAEDQLDIYAVFFETTSGVEYLDGENVKNSEALVKVAFLGRNKYKPTSEWTKFEIPFEMVQGKTIDRALLKEGRYRLSIVASSSINGAIFEGAVGSTLWLDEVELFCK